MGTSALRRVVDIDIAIYMMEKPNTYKGNILPSPS